MLLVMNILQLLPPIGFEFAPMVDFVLFRVGRPAIFEMLKFCVFLQYLELKQYG